MPPSRLNRATLPGNAVWKRRRKLRSETGVMEPRSEIRASSLASFSMSSLMTSFKASSCSCWVVDAVPIRFAMKSIPYVPVNVLGGSPRGHQLENAGENLFPRHLVEGFSRMGSLPLRLGMVEGGAGAHHGASAAGRSGRTLGFGLSRAVDL